jgi:hypothetical protein
MAFMRRKKYFDKVDMSLYPVYFGPQIAGGVRGKEVEHDTEAPGTPGQDQTGHDRLQINGVESLVALPMLGPPGALRDALGPPI